MVSTLQPVCESHKGRDLTKGNHHFMQQSHRMARHFWFACVALIVGTGTSLATAQSPAFGALQVVAGFSHSCAITESGGVKCWGGNDRGQLGDTTLTDRTTPVDVSGLQSGVTAIAAGSRHTCALTSSGGVKCWGFNIAGGLGDGTITDRTAPVDVVGLGSGVTAIAAGGYRSCALTLSAGMKCWGDNTYGGLGDNSKVQRTTPVDVVGLTAGVAAIATGFDHSCALTASGGVKCWGRNDFGLLGDGTTNQSNTAIDTSGLTTGVIAIAAGSYHTCVVTANGAAKCWGDNVNGELGDNSTLPRTTPVAVSGLTSGVVAIAPGRFYTCALTNAGVMMCWGINARGELGDGTTDERHIPVATNLAAGVAAIAAGGTHTCAITTRGGVKCWGNNSSGQIGDDSTTSHNVAVAVHTLNFEITSVAVSALGKFFSTANRTCAIAVDGGVKCWGRAVQDLAQRNKPIDIVELTTSVTALAPGSDHTCALLAGGGVKCWGLNQSGQLGNTSAGSSSTPLDVSGLGTGVVTISAGVAHTCALLTNGGVKCWGLNDHGQLGDNSATSIRPTPVDVSGLTSGVVSIAAGSNHTCAITTSGAVKCWGENQAGELGDGGPNVDRRSPVDVIGLSGAVSAISAGDIHTCALFVTGAVKCWGNNSASQRGPFTNAQQSDFAALTTGGYHNCALTLTGGAKCWGDNSDGQLGPAGVVGSTSSSVLDVSGLASGVAEIAAGGDTTCAVTTGKAVKCWGDNGKGQLGDGTYVDRATPAYVFGLGPRPLLSASANPAPLGQPVTYSASVDGNAPTGTFTFKSNGVPIPGCGSIAVANGYGACSAVFNANGSRVISVTYNGDAANSPSVAALAQITAPPFVADVTVTFSGGPNGSVSPNYPVSVTAGGSVLFSALPNAGFQVNIGGTCPISSNAPPRLAGPITANCTVAVTFTPVVSVGFAAAASSAQARASHTATLLNDGRVLVTGGVVIVSSTTYLASAERYDRVSNSWSAAGNMQTARSGHSATLLADGRVLVTGGANAAQTALSNVEIYNPATNSWALAASLPAARSRHSALLLPDGSVLVAGGGPTTLSRYDPALNSWSDLPTTAVTGTAALLNSGKVLIIDTASAKLFDPATNGLSNAGAMPTTRADFAVVVLADGRVLTAGGRVALNTSSAVDIYNPATNTWSAAAPMSVPRTAPMALLTNGQVLVVAGSNNSGTLNSAEVYDPGTNTWAGAGNLTIGRSDHSATRLANGAVLIHGGRSITNYYSSSELYIGVAATAPGAPINVIALPGNGQVTLSFDPPASNGGAPIASYTATCSSAGRPNAISTATTSPITVTGLVNFVGYGCTIVATNPAGDGAASAAVFVFPVDPPMINSPTTAIGMVGQQFDYLITSPSVATSYTFSGQLPDGVTLNSTTGQISGTPTQPGIFNATLFATNGAGTGTGMLTITIAAEIIAFNGVVSRKIHGAAGMFDVVINPATPIDGAIDVEPRAISGGHLLVFQFDRFVSGANGAIVRDAAGQDVGTIVNQNYVGPTIELTLTDIPDDKRIKVTIDSINGTTTASASIGFLVGDVNNTRSVNSSDISGVKARSGQTTTALNFKFDVNASGAINSSDISAIKARSGLVLP